MTWLVVFNTPFYPWVEEHETEEAARASYDANTATGGDSLYLAQVVEKRG